MYFSGKITATGHAKPKYSFEAKLQNDWELPGNSGHMHVSIVDNAGTNLFARDTEDKSAPYSDIAFLSDLGRHFLAGLIDGLPDIMPILAPNVNSYKRLVENFWAPVTVSWGELRLRPLVRADRREWDVVRGRNLDQNITLQAGDVVVVP